MSAKSGEYTEEDIQKALAELTEGVHHSVAATAKAYCTPPRTLQWHIKHGPNATRQQAHQPQQLLTPAQASNAYQV
jgi:hypothetical protein